MSSEFYSINLAFIGKVDSIKYKTKFTGIGALKKFDEMELSTKGVKTIGFKSDSLKASLVAKNQKMMVPLILSSKPKAIILII